MTKVFISYHHANDQEYKNVLRDLNTVYEIFEDCSVHTGDISDDLTSEAIRTKIRDEYLRESQVTILLCGTETKYRKHIDWELKSSMIDGAVNKKSGILVINLPTVTNWETCNTSLPNEQKVIYPEITSWRILQTKQECKELYPQMPERIIDNMINLNTCIPVIPWNKATENLTSLKWLIDTSALNARNNDYDLALPMRRQNYNP